MKQEEMHMKMIGRIEAAKRLGMTPQALSCHVSRRAWPHSIPAPIKVGGVFRWSEERLTSWINEKFIAVEGEKTHEKDKRAPGRPRKTRSA